MAGFWEMVAMLANLVQILGVDAVKVITAVVRCVWQLQEVDKERRKLEDSVRVLEQLLHSPTGRLIVQQQQLLGHLASNAIRAAAELARSYSEISAPSRLVLGGAGMAAQFRDLRFSVESYCLSILFINAFLLVEQGNPPHPPPPPAPSSPLIARTEVNGVVVPPSPGGSTDAETPSTAAPDEDTHIVDISQLE